MESWKTLVLSMILIYSGSEVRRTLGAEIWRLAYCLRRGAVTQQQFRGQRSGRAVLVRSASIDERDELDRRLGFSDDQQ
ncbi:hypothetical protein F0562_032072 [Nyssa sinensis]|uniref:Uncharacterized protein n=1 Tax=Nyssa sinensis TaxID=561372 RepID=A0A5J5ATV2_9ASTE|nr:hypothetical protein F0562_032072 [Nyssa sinensis]